MTINTFNRRMFLKSGLLVPLVSFATTQAKAAPNLKGKIVIIGGGAGGITVAARLAKSLGNFDITVIEPAKTHIYQAGQTLVGGGIIKKEQLTKPTKDLIPNGVKWLQTYVTEIDADNNTLTISNQKKITYDYLVVSTGLKYNFENIEGLSLKDIGENGIHSIYDFQGSQKAWEDIQKVVASGGEMVFTHPNTPIKCGGAPKKIMYLAEDYARLQGKRDGVKISLIDSNQKLFGVPEFEKAIGEHFQQRDIHTQLNHVLIKVDKERKIATFKTTKEVKGEWDPDLEEHEIILKTEYVEKKYDFLHVPPPMSAHDVIKNSKISWQKGKLSKLGFVQVDKETLQHPKYKNVFSLGDVAGIPFGKTGGSIRKQAPILVENLVSVMGGKQPTAKYNGYTVCPIITNYGKVMLAEFDYKGKPTPIIPLDPTQPRWIWWILKVYILEPMYYHGMLRGLA